MGYIWVLQSAEIDMVHTAVEETKEITTSPDEVNGTIASAACNFDRQLEFLLYYSYLSQKFNAPHAHTHSLVLTTPPTPLFN